MTVYVIDIAFILVYVHYTVRFLTVRAILFRTEMKSATSRPDLLLQNILHYHLFSWLAFFHFGTEQGDQLKNTLYLLTYESQ